MTKKIFALTLALIMALAFAGCAVPTAPAAEPAPAAAPAAEPAAPAAPAAEPAAAEPAAAETFKAAFITQALSNES